jgi:hypothetical protein
MKDEDWDTARTAATSLPHSNDVETREAAGIVAAQLELHVTGQLSAEAIDSLSLLAWGGHSCSIRQSASRLLAQLESE